MSLRKLAFVVVAFAALAAAPRAAHASLGQGVTGCTSNGNTKCSNGLTCVTNKAGLSICCAAACGSGQVCLDDGSACCASGSACHNSCCTGSATCNSSTNTCCSSGVICNNTCCGSSSQVCNAGACCTPTGSCTGKTCGTVSDGCGNTLTCGSNNGGCPSGQTCVANVCTAGCTAKTCATGGYTCGTNIPDGCGGTIASCGSSGACAVAGQICTTANTCCTPKTCVTGGFACGTALDGCGDAIDCGTCSAGQTCVNNACVSCSPITCASAGKNCGSISDGCGSTLNCGSCTSPNSCGGGGVANVCGTGTVTQTASFSAGALIIPMDQCYNNDYSAGADYTSNGTTCAANAQFACYRNYSGGNVRLPFGLIYLLAVNNIPVSIILNPTKRGLGDADFSVTPPAGSTTQTASHVTYNGTAWVVNTADMSCGTNTVYYGGMPFIVDGPYADQALQVIKNFNAANGNLFTPVPLQIINYDFQAPVLGVMASRPKPVGIDGSPLTTYFDESGITSVVPNGSTYVTISGTAPNFTYTWPSAAAGTNPACPGDVCSSLTYTPSGATQAQKILDVLWVHNPQYNQWSDINAFYQLGGTALVVADATQWEASGPGVGGSMVPAANGAQKGPYCATVAVPGANLNATPGPTADYPASNKYLQIGDMDLFVHGVGGGDGSAYTFNATPAPHTHALTNTNNYTAITGHPMVGGVQTPGNVVYLGSLNSWHGGAAGKDAGLHIMYNTLIVGGDGGGSGLNPPSPSYNGVEMSRSGPVGRPTGEYYVGTFDWLIPSNPTLAGNQLYVAPLNHYPYITGHFREYKPAASGAAGLLNLNCNPSDPASACNWDVSDPSNMPVWSTRKAHVFVGSKVGTTYSMTAASSLAADATINFIGNNIGQKMGGVDYGVAAYIENKPNSIVAAANSAAKSRPAVAYVGARDGMLHAICADSNNCYGYTKGQEIWAFIPPAQKAQLDTQVAAAAASQDFSQINVGGSIRAVDVSANFNGVTTPLTVLVVGTREGNSVFALDVSDPDPGKINQQGHLQLLWESDGTDVNTGVTSYKMGKNRGAVLANTNNTVVAIVTSSTNTGVASQTGINTYMLRIYDGKVLASNQKLYTRKEPLPGGSTATITNDPPPAVTVVDTDRDGTDETVLVADYEGYVRRFVIDTANLVIASGYPSTVFDTNYKCSSTALACQPIGASPSVGLDGSLNLIAYVITGGADWARSATVHSYALGFSVPKVGTAGLGTLKLDRDLGTVTPPVTTGQGGTAMAMPLRGYSQLSVAGTDLYADATTVSVGNINQLVLPSIFPGTYGQIEKWGNLNGSVDSVATYLITQGQNFAGGTGAVIETQDPNQTGAQTGQLTFTGTSTTERIVLVAGSSSLKNSAYAVGTSTSSSRLFSVMTWLDLGY